MEIEFKVRREGDKSVVKLFGDFDDESAGEALRKAFSRAFDSGTKTIVFDLNDIQILNSYGLGKILQCYKKCKAEGTMLMVKPLKGISRELLEMLMLDSLFPVDSDPEEEAEKAKSEAKKGGKKKGRQEEEEEEEEEESEEGEEVDE